MKRPAILHYYIPFLVIM